jgi:hypothetical protein
MPANNSSSASFFNNNQSNDPHYWLYCQAMGGTTSHFDEIYGGYYLKSPSHPKKKKNACIEFWKKIVRVRTTAAAFVWLPRDSSTDSLI